MDWFTITCGIIGIIAGGVAIADGVDKLVGYIKKNVNLWDSYNSNYP